MVTTISEKFEIYSLASGSKGNCLLIKAGGSSLLVDLGISYRRLLIKLAELQLTPADLSGVFITHEHTDHVSGLPTFLKNADVHVFARESTWRSMRFWRDVRKNYCQKLPGGMLLGDWQIDTFGISHDATEPIGLNFYYGGQKCSVLTDIGFPASNVREKIRNADILVLEANHDPDMLWAGSYPQMLKQRIRGTKGHLSNEDAGWLLAQITEQKNMKVLLAHLSQENNTPQLALETVGKILRQHDKAHKVSLQVASQEKTIVCR